MVLFAAILFICVTLTIVAWRWLFPPKDYGHKGEEYVAKQLKQLPKEYIVLNDVMFPTRYGTTQIDHLVVSPYGIFIIETKTYTGQVIGCEDADEWAQRQPEECNRGGRSGKEIKFRNPIRQNQSHSLAVTAILKEVGDFPIISIVVFSDKADLSRVKAPRNTIINWGELLSVITSHKRQMISTSDVRRIATKLSSANVTGRRERAKHTNYVKSVRRDREWAIAHKRCPKCGGNLVERQGRYGEFWGCSNFPKCKFMCDM